METTLDKYDRLRPFITHGSLALFHGNGIMANIIQNCDNAYWNHVGVVLEIEGALFILDSNGNGVQADRLSWRVSKYKGGDIAFIQPNVEEAVLKIHLAKLLKRTDRKWVKYDFINGGKELANRKWDLNFKITLDEDRDICSDLVSEYAKGTRMVLLEEFNKLRIAFPEDYDRFRNPMTTNFLK